MFKKSHHRITGAVAASALVVAALLGSSGTAGAAAGPVLAGLTLTPTSSAVGQSVIGVATAKNTSGATIAQVSMGIDIPAGFAYTALVRPLHATCRATFVVNHRLVYCSVSNLTPGQTATLQVTVAATAKGVYKFDSYARQTYTTTDTFAYATLTVS